MSNWGGGRHGDAHLDGIRRSLSAGDPERRRLVVGVEIPASQMPAS